MSRCHESKLEVLGSDLLCQQERPRLRPDREGEEAAGSFLHDGDADLATLQNQATQLTGRASLSEPNALDLTHLREEEVAGRADEAMNAHIKQGGFLFAGESGTENHRIIYSSGSG